MWSDTAEKSRSPWFGRTSREARPRKAVYGGRMSEPDPDTAWAAFVARDRAQDGAFVVGVTSTGIYCRASCPARRPKREHARFFADGAAAEAAGFRACRRCMPEAEPRDRVAVARVAEMLREAEAAVPLGTLATTVGYAPHHLSRIFKRATGLTPAAYARALRAERVREALSTTGGVTSAIYDAGYAAPSRFYDDAGAQLGMTPSAWVRGGTGVTIAWTVPSTSLGALLIAATDKGLCRVAFDSDETALRARFPAAEIVAGGDALDDLAARVVAEVEAPGRDTGLPRDVQGTAFQEAVWAALRAIPAGETRSYAELAVAAGYPNAVRAVGSACGANPLAVVVPCHRVWRGDGSAGGYAWGLERKAALRGREG